MKNKEVILIIFLSFLLTFELIYINYFNNKIYFKNISDYEQIEVFDEYKKENVVACFGNKYKCKSINYKINGTINNKKVGKYILTYNAKYGKKSLKKEKEIRVIDTKKPELIIEGNFDNVCPNGKNDNVILSATDNYDGDITNNIKYLIKDNKIIYKVSDSSGNTTKKEFNANIKDDEKPTILLDGDKTIYLSVNSKYEELGYVAIDNCDGDITKKVNITGKIDTSKEGVYTLTYSVSDSNNNKVSVNRTIRVFKKNIYKPEDVLNKVIYLTFDDGPGAHTQRLLDILKKYDVKVTFFVTGYDPKYADLIKREYEEGHTVGLHSMSHNYAKIYVSEESFMEDLFSINEYVKKYTNVDSKIIRFPGGSSNTVSRRYRNGIMSQLTKKVEDLGFRYFDWTISSGDAGSTKDTNQIFKNVTSALKENKANVVLMHDIKSYSVDAVEKIIQYGLSNGYTFAPLTLKSPVIHQSVNN